MRDTRTTISGKRDSYAKWRAAVVAEADRASLPDAVRDQVTESMMRDAWEKHERPEFFITKMAEYFGEGA
jgi:hypothetical protein